MFVGQKLRLARTFHGLTQKQLAETVSVSNVMVHHLETGGRQPSDSVLQALTEALSVTHSFFEKPIADEFRDEDCHFRKRATTPVSVKTRVLAHGTLFNSLVMFVDENVALPERNVPELDAATAEDIERAAERCRMAWGLGLDTPITHMARVLENAGVVVTRFEGHEKVDAFSRPGVRYVVVLNSEKDSASRTRWDMAHELGHLVLHAGAIAGDPAQEDGANRFAGAFLLARAGFLREFPPMPQRLAWDVIWRMKRRWKVSAAALVRRAYDLDRIDAIRYRSAYKYLHYKGWAKDEPYEPEMEQPELVQTALRFMQDEEGITSKHVASALGWSAPLLEKVAGNVLPPPPPADDAGDGTVVTFPRRGRC